MVNRNKEVGAWGESKAAEYLLSKNYQIVERNFRTAYGEIDLIAQKEDVFYFVEVKTRTSDKFGLPEEAVSEKKLNKMIESAQDYLQAHFTDPVEWQLDVISILTNRKQNETEIYHIENVSS